jgi:hypothetical protein
LTPTIPRAVAFRGIAAAVLLTLGSSSAWATDPLVLFLLRAIRDQIVMNAAETALDAMNRPAPPQYGYLQPPPLVSPEQDESRRLKAIIDESYEYLSPAQREQVHASLMKILADPENAALRPQIVESFTRTARAVGRAQQTLRHLSHSQKLALAADARLEYEKLGPDQRREMMRILRAGQAPLPSDLTEMMVAEFLAADRSQPD